MTTSGPQRIVEFIDRFNTGVRTGAWDEYLGQLAENVRMEFKNGGPEPLDGRDAVAAAYAAAPPDDTITVLNLAAEGLVDIVEFAWDGGGDGTMRIAWTPDDRVATVVIEFA